MRFAAGLFSRRSFSVSSRVLAGTPPKRPVPKSNGPNPLVFVLLGAVSFAGLSYVTKIREAESRDPTREKRIPAPNPLIPTPKKETE